MAELRAASTTANETVEGSELTALKTQIDENLDECSKGFAKENESTNLKSKWAEDERDKWFQQMEDALEKARLKEEHIKDQEEQIRAFNEEIRRMKELVEEKKAEIKRLQEEIKIADAEIEKLEKEIDALNRHIGKLETAIAEKEEYLQQLADTLAEKEALVNQLSHELGSAPPAHDVYRATKGDLVDEMLAQFINIANCPVPIKRLGGGFYLFGLKKIYAKIMNGKLVIRVGGGYMIVEEFIQSYAEAELHKLNALAEREGVASFTELDLEYYALKKKTAPGSPGGRGSAGSPRGSKGSPKARGSPKNSRINGSSRVKSVTTNQIKQRF